MTMDDNAVYTFVAVKNNVAKDANMRRHVLRTISTHVLDIEVESSGNGPRFRYHFDLQEPGIISLYETLKLNESENDNLFPSIADSCTNLLMLLTSVGISLEDDILARRSFFLVLVKTWNISIGQHFPEGIDDSLLEMAIDMSHDELLNKYQTPFYLLTDYMLPSLLDPYTYTKMISPMRAMNLLHIDTYQRIDQLFKGKYSILDRKTKQRRCINGIEPFYREVKAFIKENSFLDFAH